ncbi:MAG: hypothetical protein LLF76_04625 [Planctomycetaceae bacterium]|nr:hypothetical protein [Planctomycetaceae bacterium]
MTNEKKTSNPVTWARDCFKASIALLGILAITLIVSITANYFGKEGILDSFAGIGVGIVCLLPIPLFIASLISLAALLITGSKSKKLYLQVLFSSAICVLVFGVIILGFIQSEHNAAVIVCRTNLKYLDGCTLSAIRNNAPFDKEKWCDRIKAEVVSESTMKCVWDKIGPCSYAMNENIPADANDLPPDLVVLFESAPGWNQTGGPAAVVTDRHGKNPGANIAFADGRVEFVKAADIPKLKWAVTQTDKLPE